MDIVIDWNDLNSDPEPMELGSFKDLKDWVGEFNKVWAGKSKFELKKDKNNKDSFIFVEDDYEVGVIQKIDNQAIAASEMVHGMVFDVYNRYMDEFGGEMAT